RECVFARAVDERDEIAGCPQCGGKKFKRASMFMDRQTQELDQVPEVIAPDWLRGARGALVADGDYVGLDRDGRVNVVPLQNGWTRVSRSLSAHVPFDD